MRIGGRDFDTKGRTYVWGILNVTPDSFSDGGRWNEVDRALFHVEDMIGQGMDLLDIGGESTRPGYTPVSEEEEIRRVVPVIEAVKRRFDIPVSLDTSKGSVAAAGIEAGADLINDVWGLQYDDKIASVISRNRIHCCLMHNRKSGEYQNFWTELEQDLDRMLLRAREAGIPRDRIILDPGVGFAKSYENNLEVLRRLEELHSFELPLLLGCSRKSVIGLALDLPKEERLEGTIATTVLAVMKGCSFVRVHDVRENVRAVRMTEAILQGGVGRN